MGQFEIEVMAIIIHHRDTESHRGSTEIRNYREQL
jgi:hypothetical protein